MPISPNESPILVCFAVKEESKFFEPSRVNNHCERLVTGMGRKNAGEKFRQFLAGDRPQLVITSGFAGGLNPQLSTGAVVFEEDRDVALGNKLRELGATPARFHCADHVAVTAADKLALWKSTGADAVEMESSVIRSICLENNIPSATIRVISDAAQEDLPLDFNALMTADDRINWVRLATKLIGNPQKIPSLMKFQRQTISAARKLAEVLHQSLGRG
jgi:nucleoside phosphorylase